MKAILFLYYNSIQVILDKIFDNKNSVILGVSRGRTRVSGTTEDKPNTRLSNRAKSKFTFNVKEYYTSSLLYE